MASRRLVLLVGVMTVVMLGMSAFDILREPVLPPWDEIVVDLGEKAILLAAMAVVAWTVYGLLDLREDQVALGNTMARAVAQGDVWRTQRRQEIAAMGQAIADQFELWRLTAAESDVAGLMLKGMSLKEIALARDTTETTIRQQAQSIYRKSGLSGRAELSAYFLESLFETAEDSARKTAAREKPSLTVISKLP